MCEYTITFASKHACPAGTRKSRGWLFVTFVMLTAFCYFGVGTAIKWHKYGLRGAEAVPNIELWRELPGLVRDGVTFSTANAKSGYNMANEKFLKGKLPFIP